MKYKRNSQSPLNMEVTIFFFFWGLDGERDDELKSSWKKSLSFALIKKVSVRSKKSWNLKTASAYSIAVCLKDSKRLGAQWLIGKVWLRNLWKYSTVTANKI